MSIKSEPVDFDQEGLSQLVVVPTHLVANSTVPDDLTAMQTATPDTLFPKQTYNTVNQTVTASGDLLRTEHSAARSVKRYSKFDNLLSMRARPSAKTGHPSFTIARGEIELNSKLLPKKYMCGFCVYKTSYKSDLNRHLRRHSQEANFHCQICNMPFKTEGLVFHHRRTAHGELPSAVRATYQCHMCPYGTRFEERFNRHMQMHSTSNHVCNVCNKPFVIENMMIQHKTSAHGIISYPSQIDTHSPGGIRKTDQTASSGFQVSSLSNENILCSPPLETIIVDDENVRSSSYCSVQELDNVAAGVENEVTNGCPQPNTSPVPRTLPHDLPHDEDISRGGASFENGFAKNGSQTCDLQGIQVANVSSIPATPYSNDVIQPVGRSVTDSQLMTSGQVYEETNRSTMYGRALGVTTKTLASASGAAVPSIKSVRDEERESEIPTSASQTMHYCCERCGHIFRSLNAILNHKPACIAEDFSYVKACSLCPFQTNNHHVFEKHSEKHSVAPYCCEFCNRPFIALENLMKHKRELHGNLTENSLAFGRSSKTTFGRLPRTRLDVCSFRGAGYSTSLQKNRNASFLNERMHLPNRPFVTKPTNCGPDNDLGLSLPISANDTDQKSRSDANTLVTSQPPESGRYAKLVSDFDEFAARPYACALCFFRTNDTSELTQHAKNHLTGCNIIPIPETARFLTTRNHRNQLQGTETPPIFDSSFTASEIHDHRITHRQTTTDRELGDAINDGESSGEMETNSANYREEETKHDDSDFVRRQKQCSLKTLRTFIKGHNRVRRHPFVFTSSLRGSARFPCNSCDKSFSVSVLLARHVRNVHDFSSPSGGT